MFKRCLNTLFLFYFIDHIYRCTRHASPSPLFLSLEEKKRKEKISKRKKEKQNKNCSFFPIPQNFTDPFVRDNQFFGSFLLYLLHSLIYYVYIYIYAHIYIYIIHKISHWTNKERKEKKNT